MTDLSRDPVFLKGKVLCGTAFAQAMLALGQIVKTSARATVKDHSAYQEWVQGQYLKELDATKAALKRKLPKLKARDVRLREEIKALEDRIRTWTNELYDYKTIRSFYDWLYTHNREAWIAIDPIVSVQSDATFFEGFSVDESIYGRVKLPHKSIESDAAIRPGTTNIDFSLGLDKEFSRIRSYRPMQLTVGSGSVTVETDIGTAVERKIDLPDSWVRGLVEVQSALVFAPIDLVLSPLFIADILAILEGEKEKHGPRSLRFRLLPGEPVSIEIEPWGVVRTDHESQFSGDRVQEIRIWGRRRLKVLTDLLTSAERLHVRLLGSGMPSFWSATQDGVEFTVGLTGWTSLDWASRTRFSAIIPTGNVSEELVLRTAALLKASGGLTADELTETTQAPMIQARGALQALCLGGKAMFEPETNLYRWRELFAEFDLAALPPPGLEERKGIELSAASAVTIEKDLWESGRHHLVATVSDDDDRTTTLDTDVDGHVLYAECTCSYFRYHKLREGPCRHLVALAANGAGGSVGN
jgi:hypothetical protein